MASTYRALVLSSFNEPVEIKSLPTPSPQAGEVVVRILVAPLVPYLRDIFTNKRPYPLSLPLTPGGKAIGRIQSVGPDAVSLKTGQLVYCDAAMRARDDPYSAPVAMLGVHKGISPEVHSMMENVWRNGTMGELAKLPLENVYPLNEEILTGSKALAYEFGDLALLQLCVVPYGGLRDIDVKSGDTVIVAPATGKFGGAAVLVALAMGANVVAAGRSTAVLNSFTEKHGYTGRIKTVVLTGDQEKDTAALKAACPNGSADAFIDFSPPESDGSTHIIASLKALRVFGRASLMGWTPGTVNIPYELLGFKSLTVKGRFLYDREHVSSLIKMAEAGMLKLGDGAGVKALGFSMDDIEKALDASEENKKWGTQVTLML